MKAQRILWLTLFTLVAITCTVVKKQDNEEDIRSFLSGFQQQLSQSDDVLLKYFEARQSREVLLTAIGILKNQTHEFIQCEPFFSKAEISKQEDGVRVTIPVTFKSLNLEQDFTEKTNLILWVHGRKGGLVITKIEADDFYKAFAKIRNTMEWLVERKREINKREPLYSAARTLQNNFDSIIWFTQYRDQSYFYAVKGNWVNYFRDYGKKPEFRNESMALVNSDGEIIIPFEYDLIGTLGFNFKDLVEVKKDGKAGYYDFINGEEIVPAEYDLVIPLGKDNVLCVAKRDSTYGWYSFDGTFAQGFPSVAIEKWVKEFGFLPNHLQLDAGTHALCEIPSVEHAGFGIVIPPSYLVKTGIFSEIIGGISPTEFPMQGWTDYIETEGTLFTNVTESLFALVTTIKERYLDGREEFYRHKRLVFVGPGQDTLSVNHLATSDGKVNFRKIDSMLEVNYVPHDEYYFEGSNWPDIVPVYSYYSLTDDLKIVPLKSRRYFAQTEFVKLDSSYFSGQFQHYSMKVQDGVEFYGFDTLSFISPPTIAFMRNEILASYGFRFDDEELNQWFFQFKDVAPRTFEEIQSILTDIDRHNLSFLEELINPAAPAI